MKLLSLASPRRYKSLAVVLGIACLAQQGMAATVFHWGGNYVSAYQGIVGTPTTSAGSSTWNYSSTTAKSPGSSGYTGPKFYGAFSLINGNGTGTPVFRDNLSGVADSASTDQIRFSASAPATSTVRMRGLVFFNKDSFLGNASTGTVTFDSESSIKLLMGTSIGAGSRSMRMAVYALVGTEWSWYISSNSQSGSGTPFEIAPLTASWGRYSIDESSAPLSAAPSSFTTLGSAFTDIGAVGFFFDYLSGTNAAASMYLTSFEVNGNVAIPEPSTAMLWLGGALVAVTFRKVAGRR